jgi:hypothetical protein
VAFEVQGDVVHARDLVLGAERGDRVIVKTGLAGGELLVTSPPESLQDGDKVKTRKT